MHVLNFFLVKLILFTNMEIKMIAVASRSFSKNDFLRSELLKKYDNVIFNETGKSLEGDELVKFLSGSNKAIIALEKIDDSILSKLPDLEVISKYGVGLNNLDYYSLLNNKIKVGWVKGVNKRSVAELALSFALILIRKSYEANLLIKNKSWQQVIGSQLSGKTFGIIGCGNVGQELIKLLSPFNCKIIFNDISESIINSITDAKYVLIDELLINSDIVSLHIPYLEKNLNYINESKLNLMKKTAVFINTSRGNLVDESYLKRLLIQNKQFTAGFDVFAQEPFFDDEMLNLSNFFATPHIGGSSIEAIINMGMAAIDGLENNYNVEKYYNEWFL